MSFRAFSFPPAQEPVQDHLLYLVTVSLVSFNLGNMYQLFIIFCNTGIFEKVHTYMDGSLVLICLMFARD